MQVTRTSQASGMTNTMELDITPEQVAAYEGGELLQRAFPTLPKELREFYKTGITPEEWKAIFG